MTKPADKVIPLIVSWLENGPSGTYHMRIATNEGLTKREWFAGMALQGLLVVNTKDQTAVAQQACDLADLLIKGLNKK